MRKLIAAINMTLDGYCDHTAGIVNDELHQHYNELLREAGVIIYGRITYQLMESSWPAILKNPTGNRPIDEFAAIIDNIPKIVFSHTLTSLDWSSARLATGGLKETVMELKRMPGNDILVGSRSLIVALTKLNLVDEFQLCVHPVIAGKGLPLFKDITDRVVLELINSKTLGSTSIVLYYIPANT